MQYIVLDCRYFRPIEEHLLDLLSIYRDMGMNGVIVEWGRYFPWTFDERLSSHYAYPEEVICGVCRRCRDLGMELINALPLIDYERIIAGHSGFSFLLSIKKDEAGFRKFIQSYLNFTEELISDFYNLLGGGTRICIGGAGRFSASIDKRLWLNELLHPLFVQLSERNYRPLVTGFESGAFRPADENPEIREAWAEQRVDVLIDVPAGKPSVVPPQKEDIDGGREDAGADGTVRSVSRPAEDGAVWYRLLFPENEFGLLPASGAEGAGRRGQAGASAYQAAVSSAEAGVRIVLPDPALLPAGSMRHQPREAALRRVHAFLSGQPQVSADRGPVSTCGQAAFPEKWEKRFAAAESLMPEISGNLQQLQMRMWNLKALLARATIDAEERALLGRTLCEEREELREGISKLSELFDALCGELQGYVHERCIGLFTREYLCPVKEDYSILSGRIDLIL